MLGGIAERAGDGDRPQETAGEGALESGTRLPAGDRTGGGQAARQRDADPFPRQRGNDAGLIAEPVEAGRAFRRAPAVGDVRDRLRRADAAGGAEPVGQRRRLARDLDEQAIRPPAGPIESPASRGEAKIGGAVLLKQQPGIAAPEHVQLDPPGEQPVERGACRQPEAQADRVAFRPAKPAQFMLPGGKEDRVGRYLPAVGQYASRLPAPRRDAAFDRRAGLRRAGQQRHVERAAGQPGGRCRQHGLGATLAREHHQTLDPVRAERLGIDAQRREPGERGPAQETAAQRILRHAAERVAGLGVALDQQRPQAVACQPDRSGGTRRTAAHDQRI